MKKLRPRAPHPSTRSPFNPLVPALVTLPQKIVFGRVQNAQIDFSAMRAQKNEQFKADELALSGKSNFHRFSDDSRSFFRPPKPQLDNL